LPLGASAVIALLAAVIFPAPVIANRESAILRARASEELYNLDRERAVETFKQAVAADPQDGAAYRGLAGAYWLSISFRRGTMTVDDFMGGLSRSRSSLTPPSPERAGGVSKM